MAKLEIPIVVDIDAVAELIDELKDLQTYKLSASDDIILVSGDEVVKIFTNHVKAKRRKERETGRWIDNETSYADDARQTCTCSVCGRRSHRPLGRFCRWCGARMEADT